jgi:hypothetical protein
MARQQVKFQKRLSIALKAIPSLPLQTKQSVYRFR